MKYYMFNGLNKKSETSKPKKELNKKKIWKLIILLFCTLLIISSIVLYTTNEKCREILDKYVFRKEVQEDDLPSIEIDSSKNINAAVTNRVNLTA